MKVIREVSISFRVSSLKQFSFTGHRASSSEEVKSSRSNKGKLSQTMRPQYQISVLETKMRESILSRITRRKASESDDDTTEQRFSIQPKDAQKAKEDRYREKERERRKDHRGDDRRGGRDIESRQRDRDHRSKNFHEIFCYC